jgi:hypothetical protein
MPASCSLTCGTTTFTRSPSKTSQPTDRQVKARSSIKSLSNCCHAPLEWESSHSIKTRRSFMGWWEGGMPSTALGALATLRNALGSARKHWAVEGQIGLPALQWIPVTKWALAPPVGLLAARVGAVAGAAPVQALGERLAANGAARVPLDGHRERRQREQAVRHPVSRDTHELAPTVGARRELLRVGQGREGARTAEGTVTTTGDGNTALASRAATTRDRLGALGIAWARNVKTSIANRGASRSRGTLRTRRIDVKAAPPSKRREPRS